MRSLLANVKSQISNLKSLPMSRPIIKPTTLKGFRDYLPSAMIAREKLFETARLVYRSYGLMMGRDMGRDFRFEICWL